MREGRTRMRKRIAKFGDKVLPLYPGAPGGNAVPNRKREKAQMGRPLGHPGLHDLNQTATVTEVSVRMTGRYMVSRSMGSRPASRIRRISSWRRMPCGVVA